MEWSNLPGVTGHELNIDDVQVERNSFGRSQYEVFKGRFHGAAVRGSLCVCVCVNIWECACMCVCVRGYV